MLIMALCGNIWIMGEKKIAFNELYLVNPRAYMVVKDKHGFVPLPGRPEEVNIRGAVLYYVQESEELIELYKKEVEDRQLIVPNQEIVH